jgi:hypothetical protein
MPECLFKADRNTDRTNHWHGKEVQCAERQGVGQPYERTNCEEKKTRNMKPRGSLVAQENQTRQSQKRRKIV